MTRAAMLNSHRRSFLAGLLALALPQRRLRAQPKSPILTECKGRTVTSKEWAAIVAADPVLQFYQRVSDVATADPIWPKDFRRSWYEACVKEYGAYIQRRYRICLIAGTPEGDGDA